jgi:hypothetical protein
MAARTGAEGAAPLFVELPELIKGFQISANATLAGVQLPAIGKEHIHANSVGLALGGIEGDGDFVSRFQG